MAVPDDERRDRAFADVRARRGALRQAMSALERALAAPVPGRSADWWAGVAACLGDLRRALERHIAETEAPDGFFTQIVSDAPRLAHAVDRLRRDHVEITEAVDALAKDGDRDSAAVREEGLELLGRLARHRHLGADLLYEAYRVDVGPAD